MRIILQCNTAGKKFFFSDEMGFFNLGDVFRKVYEGVYEYKARSLTIGPLDWKNNAQHHELLLVAIYKIRLRSFAMILSYLLLVTSII